MKTPPRNYRRPPTKGVCTRCMVACFAFLILTDPIFASDSTKPPVPISLRECIETALRQNRDLQIERISPEIARLGLQSANAYYDPFLSGRVEKVNDKDTGGFDPTDFSRDAVYDAESEVATGALSGFLPSGLSYSIGGVYTHSSGTRNALDFDSYKLGASVAIQQPLLKNFWTDSGRTAIRVSRKNLKISELGVAFLTMDVVNQVQQAYTELQWATENLNVRQNLLATKEQTLTAVHRQVEVGTLTVLEERLAVSQVALVTTDVIAASNSVALAGNALHLLLGHSLDQWDSGLLTPASVLFTSPESFELAESWRMAFEQRPDLAQIRQELERNDIELKFHHNQLFPSLDIVASYGRRGSSLSQTLPNTRPGPDASLNAAWDQVTDGDAPRDMIGLVLSTPLSRSRERANYATGKQLREQAQLRLKQREELILREISDALHNAKSALERVQASGAATESTKAALAAEEQKLAAGKSTLFFVLQLQTDVANAQAAEVRAKADYSKALSQLRFAEGSILRENNLVLQVD